jgi:MoaA/NifB/PqqE/SkfB family radical SAM enzyme
MFPRFLEIEITGKCTYKCRHCYGSFPKAGELSLDKVHEIVSQSHGLFDCLILSGGEPFVHPDLTKMVLKASQEFVVFITTSGFGISENHIKQIQNRAVLVFGLDGIGQTHDLYRGVPGAFKTLIRAMEMTRDLPKEIIVTLWKGILPQIDEVISLGEKYNAIVHFNGIIPVGRVKDNPDILPDINELEKVYKKLYQLKMSGGPVTTDLHRVTEKDREEGIDLFCRNRFNITPEGNLRPCEFHQAVLGNIYEKPLDEIIRLAKQTILIKSREDGFKSHIPDNLPNPFDYHTSICHKLPCSCQ